MKRLRSIWQCLQKGLSRIHLIDKCLIVFMVVLLAQSAYILFFGHTTDTDNNNIDVIIRTSTAAIFGYFLSANFIREESQKDITDSSNDTDRNPTQPPALTDSAKGVQARIGFSAEESPATQELAPGNTSAQPKPKKTTGTAIANRLQIIVATSIGLFCLIVLVMLRNFTQLEGDATLTPSSSATVAQFRDLVSGCVGFLIGCPTTKSKS